MTVAELIKELRECPPDAHVLTVGYPGPVEQLIGFPEAPPNKIYIATDLDRD